MPKEISLSNKVLQYLVRRYHETGVKLFDIETIVQDFQQVKESEIVYAVEMLESKEFLSIHWASGTIYKIVLMPKGIEEAEENTPCKKVVESVLRFIWAFKK